MNLYRISQSVNDDYDTYSAAVVADESEEVARLMHPRDGLPVSEERFLGDWTKDPSNVSVRLIGVAADGIERGVICTSFHAG